MSCAASVSASAVSSATASASVSSGTGLGIGKSSEAKSALDQGARGGAGGVGNRRAGEHAGDLLLPLGGRERLHAGRNRLSLAELEHAPLGVGAGGHLRRMGDDH